MTDEEVAVTLEGFRKEIGSLKHRMDVVEELTHSVNELAISVKELAVNVANSSDRMDGYEKRLKSHGERIVELEKKPAKRWDSLVNVILTALASGLVGFFISNFVQ